MLTQIWNRRLSICAQCTSVPKKTKVIHFCYNYYTNSYNSWTAFDNNTLGALLAVRRSYYPANALPGKGARWEWAGDVPGEWHTYDMESQCFLETAWAMVSVLNHTIGMLIIS